MTQTPRRWSGSELPEELNAALSSADGDSSEQAIERLRARLSDALGPAFSDAAQPSAAARAQPAARALRMLTPGKWLGLGALFAIGFGVFWIRGPGAPAGHAERGSAEGARTGPGAVHGASPGVAQAAGSAEPPTAAATGPVAQVPPTAAAVNPISETQPTAAAVEPVETVKIDLRVSSPNGSAAPAAGAPNKPSRTNKRAAQQPPTKPAELGLAEELRQLEQVRQRLRVSPARALVEADTHARRFPQGTLGPERELLRVDALLRLGRNAEARKLADRMIAAPEGHPYRTQIEKLLAAP